MSKQSDDTVFEGLNISALIRELRILVDKYKGCMCYYNAGFIDVYDSGKLVGKISMN